MMKLTKKEVKNIWILFYFSTIFFGILLERLNQIKSDEKDDVFIFGVVVALFYILLATILQFFYMSDEQTAIDGYVLWFIFIIIMSLGSMTVQATEERLETLQYFGCGFVQLYIIYLYEAYFGQNDTHGRTYLKRLTVQFKRLGRRRF